ncbi:magnesium transporter MgtE N-terminal domain-containing protein [Effusibacillus lacus]|uniref:Magnesium transporter MgtE intracellular domain-containing protein n=1 Tax=Effusibacillus lacus TaxID=1348429 RepID=A0A292YSK0_9BACL|nr:hypothetical protein [Effusibacillus lacus]TCS76030.1 MgtE-like protein [Effusibacillus lacus]GAX91450.1 hypothetical protein EFBL_3119 [Effusibacillus lacus]
MEAREERSYGKLEWLFYIIILPLLFTLLILGLVLQFMGYNVTGKLLAIARQTPVLSSIVPPDEATRKERSELQKLQAQLDEANKQLTSVQQSKDLLQQDLQTRDAELAKLKKTAEDQKKREEERKQIEKYWQDKAQIFSSMSPKNAASILSQTAPFEARSILYAMDAETKAAILAKMDPKVAASLENGSTLPPQTEPTQFFSEKARTYGSMDPAKAASILSQIPVQESRAILDQMNAESRAAIIEKMDPKIAAHIESDNIPQPAQKQPSFYGQLPPDKAAAILAELPTIEARGILGSMSTEEKAKVFAEMDPVAAARIQSDFMKPQDPFYAMLPPDKAAGILEQMPVERARAILNGMSLEKKGKILEEMDRTFAARIEMQENDLEETDDYWDTRADTFEVMAPDKAAEILAEMPIEQARAIVKHIDDDELEDILKEMDPKLAAQLLQM